MILLLHISLATLSIIFTSLAFIRPSINKLRTSYVMTGGTILSGTYLVIQKPVHLTATCFAGLTYISIMGLGLLLAKKRLAKQKM